MFIKSLYILQGGTTSIFMTHVKIENIVAFAQVADGFEISDLAEMIPDFKYQPEEFNGLTWKLDYPKTAILIISNGKIICTGGETMEDVESSIKQVITKMKIANIDIRLKPKIEIQNIIASTDVEKELHLSSISKGLLMEHVNYKPEEFPGLLYEIVDLGAVIIIFSSGRIVCTGTKNINDATKAIELMKEKLSSIGAL
jgi:transcription initiation factor TFIID TATA-box-binding protein